MIQVGLETRNCRVRAETARELQEERARVFALLARLLAAAPDAGLLSRLAGLASPPSELGAALGGLAAAARATDAARVEREYFDLFIGVGRGEVLPYASYVLTGFLHERPLAELRASLRALGIARAPGTSEPEDHIAFCCEVMAGLLEGRHPGDAEAFFARHLRPWAARCMAEIEAAGPAHFYRAVGRLGRTVFEIESAAAELPA
jgi:TorA maturation chaperone TorD